MALPAILSQGIVSIYGTNNLGISGINPIGNGFYFGEIDQVSIYSSYSIYDYVLFSQDAIKARVVYSGFSYTLVDESKIILIELAP